MGVPSCHITLARPPLEPTHRVQQVSDPQGAKRAPSMPPQFAEYARIIRINSEQTSSIYHCKIRRKCLQLSVQLQLSFMSSSLCSDRDSQNSEPHTTQRLLHWAPTSKTSLWQDSVGKSLPKAQRHRRQMQNDLELQGWIPFSAAFKPAIRRSISLAIHLSVYLFASRAECPI